MTIAEASPKDINDALGRMELIRNARMPLSEEKRIAKSLTPDVAWPTIATLLVLPPLYLVVIYLGFTGKAPLWVCTPVLGFMCYVHYMFVHEGAHRNIVKRPPFTWVNTAAGWIGAFALGAGYPLLSRSHILHHTHTNTDKDPDIHVKGSFGALIWKWFVGATRLFIPVAIFKVTAPAQYARMRKVLSTGDILGASLVTLVMIGILVAAVATGHFVEWLCLWFLPQRIAALILTVFFQWLPHYPFDRTDRYGATRISLWPGAGWITFQVNLHLMHHLWPGVPWYNSSKLYKALYPVLIAEGSRIEGLLTGKFAVDKRPQSQPPNGAADGEVRAA